MLKQHSVLVCIRCITYNHEKYIRDALEGFVMQKTDFRFEAIVHDDASTDGTAAIVKEYAEKYPDIIKPIFETENQYSKHDGSLQRIMNDAIHPDAKYIAFCEGDDYWTDPYKLQKQVDFLEKNPDYAICFHPVKVYIQNENRFVDDFITNTGVPETTDIVDLAKENYIHTPSIVLRYDADIMKQLVCLMPLLFGDYVISMLHARNGKIKRLSDEMAVYRYGVGIWSGKHEFSVRKSMGIASQLEKLSVMIDNPEAKSILLSRSDEIFNNIAEEYNNYHSEIRTIKQSMYYKLGRKISKPYRWLKKKLNNKNN